MVMVSDIESKADAEYDAKDRCQRDPTLAKIAYYKVDPASGDFKLLLTYNNPRFAGAKKLRGPSGPTRDRLAREKKAPEKKKGLISRILGMK